MKGTHKNARKVVRVGGRLKNKKVLWRSPSDPHAVCHSSSDHVYVTPDYLFKPLDRIFRFQLDAAAGKANKKCRVFFTEKEDGLVRRWVPGPVWCNPPYGRGLEEWVAKGATSCWEEAVTVVMLLPFRPDTKWFRNWVAPSAFIRPIAGRVQFEGTTSSAPFPSFLAIWVPAIRPVQMEVWHYPKT